MRVYLNNFEHIDDESVEKKVDDLIIKNICNC